MRAPSSTNAWLAANPPPDSAFRQSLAGVAQRALAGESFDFAVRELLDEFSLLQTTEQRAQAIAEEPQLTGDPRHDAYLAALGEHFALRFAVDRPQWVTRPSGGAASSSPRVHSSAADVTREEIVDALTALGRMLHERGIDGEMYVVGGAAIALALDLPPGWLNDAVTGFLVGADPAAADEVFGDRLDAASRFFVEELFASS